MKAKKFTKYLNNDSDKKQRALEWLKAQIHRLSLLNTAVSEHLNSLSDLTTEHATLKSDDYSKKIGNLEQKLYSSISQVQVILSLYRNRFINRYPKCSNYQKVSRQLANRIK